MGDPALTDTVGLQWPEPGTRWRCTRPAESMGWQFQPGDEVVVLDTVSHLDWFALLVERRGEHRRIGLGVLGMYGEQLT